SWMGAMSQPTGPKDDAHDLCARIEAARNGCARSLGSLLEIYRDYLLLVANREMSVALRGKVGASDFVQETFVRAQGAFRAFRGTTEEELRAWLEQILINRCRSARTAFLLTAKRDMSREARLDDSSLYAASGGVASKTPTPSGHALANEEA